MAYFRLGKVQTETGTACDAKKEGRLVILMNKRT